MIRKSEVYRNFRRKRWAALMEGTEETPETYQELEDETFEPEQDEDEQLLNEDEDDQTQEQDDFFVSFVPSRRR